jgi:N utilization substance protein B
MLSRHFLRAKALQTIYAGVCNQISSADELVKAFDHNVMRLNDLGLYQLSTLSQFTFTAERIMEVEMQKFNPQQKELDYLKRIADNKFISRLESGFEFKQQMNRLSIDWSNHFDIFRKILTQLKTSQQYQDYAAISDPTFDDDRNLAIQVFKIMMNDNALRSIIFERDLLWEDDFDQVAQYVYMLLKECTEENTNEASPCPQIYDSRNEKDANDFKFARKLTIDTYNHIDDVESMIKKHLQNWDFDRVALMDVLLINMAVTEFTCCPSIPERVTVDEYIELSKEFSTEKSKLFINGILDKMLIELRVAGKVVKNERGMYDPAIDGDVPPEDN